MKCAWPILAGLLAASPAAAQERIDRPGPVEHRAAGAVFPEQVGDFRRANVYRYDAGGENLSASYDLDSSGGRMVVTIYIYPTALAEAAYGDSVRGDRARLCGTEFEQARTVIRQRNPAAELTADGAAPAVDAVAPALSRRSVFRMVTDFDRREQEVRSEIDLYCYVGGAWQVKYRVTSPRDVEAEDAIERFIRLGPWPGRGTPVDPKEITAAESPTAPA